MIESIKFTGPNGYIWKIIGEPECSVRGNYDLHSDISHFSDSDQTEIQEWREKYIKWEKEDKGKYLNPGLVNNLSGREFKFSADKVNIIFGPNGSGKTTILKALAGAAGTTDGYATLQGPLDLRETWNSEIDFPGFLKKLSKNDVVVEWDGVPVYYDNFANRKTYGQIGDLGGSVLGDDILTEIQYTLSREHRSGGENILYLFSRLVDIMKEPISYSKIFKKYITADKKLNIGMNSSWNEAYRVQLEYYLGFPMSWTDSAGTFLFDEPDRSMDLLNQNTLYTEVLPKVLETTGAQIIMISHSPVILKDDVYKNPEYNIISISDEYTKNTRKALFGL